MPPRRSIAGIAICLATAALVAQAPPPAAAHWADRPIARPPVPADDHAPPGWRGPLDALVLAALRREGLAPSPPADRATWLRRVALDLTGLPPTPEEVAAFVADAAPDAPAQQVDRLLASPHFGERWAQWWLDLARYADSQGYEKDALRRTMWRYRDWVIDALQQDLPLDRFSIAQLAGDLLPDATAADRLATAFHRQTMTNTEGGTDDEEFRVAAVVDRVDTTMSVWMGATAGCAQCHDHKYDPLSQREFFGLYAFFDQTADADRPDDAPLLRVPTAAETARAAALQQELAALRAELQAPWAEVAAWAAAERQRALAFVAAAPALQPWHVLGPLPAADFATAHRTAFAPEREGVRLDAEQDGQRWRVVDYPDGRVHEWRGDRSAVYLFRTITATAAAPALLSLGSDDALQVWWNGERVLERQVGRAARPDQELLEVALRPGANTLLLKVTNGGGPAGFYCELRAGAAGGRDAAELAVLWPDPATADAAQRDALQQRFAAQAPARQAVRDRVAAAERELEAARGAAVPVLQELPPERRRETRLHRRGSYRTPGEVVLPHTPAVWPPLPAGAPSNRLGFARWLFAADNPRTARVLANRLWAELFGQGLVTTLEDFGSQGELPSHPELLDWLAAELRDRGWSLRAFLRTVVLSAAYGQTAAQDEARRERDPHNRWLWRGPAFRLAAETLRDQALAVSGLLHRAVGGPSVMPPQPDGVWLQIYSGERWKDAEGPDRHRRSLYTFWRRTSPHPAMLLFDAQSREACVLRRQRTNTPLQALVLWNDPQFHEAALALAARLAERGLAHDAAAVDWLFRRCLLRGSEPAERERLLALLAAERAAFAADPAAAAALLGAAAVPAEQAVERAAWSVLAGVLLQLDEFVTRR